MASPLPRYVKSVGSPDIAVAGGIELRGDGRFEVGHRVACQIFVYIFFGQLTGSEVRKLRIHFGH